MRILVFPNKGTCPNGGKLGPKLENFSLYGNVLNKSAFSGEQVQAKTFLRNLGICKTILSHTSGLIALIFL